MLNGDAGDQPGMVSTFFGRVAKHFANEVAVVTPNGKLLSHSLDEGLKKWREMPAGSRRKLADLGKFDPSFLPAPPKSGLVLRAYSRALRRDPEGGWQIYKTKVARSLEPGRDHLWLTGAEARSIVSEMNEAGARKPVSAAIVDRLCRRYLIDLVRVGGNGGPRRPENVLRAGMSVAVVESNPATLRLRFDGGARLATHDVGSGATRKVPKVDDFELSGTATFDRAKGRFTTFDLVAFSETGHYDEIAKKTLGLGVAFELIAGSTPADRVPPSSYSATYFDPPRNRGQTK